MTSAQALAVKIKHARENVHASAVDLTIANIEQAYAIQDAGLALVGQTLEQVSCWKIGVNSEINQCISAPIYKQQVFSHGSLIKAEHYRYLQVELELGFRLRQELHAIDAQNFTQHWPQFFHAPNVCFELVDSRLTQQSQSSALARLADNQISGGIVIGEQLQTDFDERLEHELVFDQRLIASGRGGHPQNSPLMTLATALPALLQRTGYLAAGTMILTGSWNGMHSIKQASHVIGRFNANKVEFFTQEHAR